ncbi:LysR family transcriptional regulator [Virgibacillus sp. NKC19-3]|uniref:LysR family transcriptional regulator n=1 Tax=Virgibacillus saliphilus TaxID=2831674 RepID=UPI001C9A548F|nr:LysR family transcriptional regulator [Virgibacillus sp. NKC19-3]MBY7142563.1 LysR family transcriptional regulator [Virgibacillus sp. NKC19-3]
MDYQQLNYFKTIAEIQHFTYAAEKLFISQPTLSRSIAKLEKEIGVPLFERNGRKIKLNPYGEIFYKKAVNALQEINEGKQEILDLVNPEYGRVSIGFLKSLGSSLFPTYINTFHKEFPNVNFQFFQNPSDIMLDQLENGEIDFCISAITDDRENIKWEHLRSEEIFAFVSVDHKLANFKTIHLTDLADEKFIALKKGYSLRPITDHFFRQAGVQPNITFEGDDTITIMGLVGANLGVSLLPKIQGFYLDNVKCLKVTEPKCERPIGLAWNSKRYLSPVAKRFQQFLLNH